MSFARIQHNRNLKGSSILTDYGPEFNTSDEWLPAALVPFVHNLNTIKRTDLKTLYKNKYFLFRDHKTLFEEILAAYTANSISLADPISNLQGWYGITSLSDEKKLLKCLQQARKDVIENLLRDFCKVPSVKPLNYISSSWGRTTYDDIMSNLSSFTSDFFKGEFGLKYTSYCLGFWFLGLLRSDNRNTETACSYVVPLFSLMVHKDYFWEFRTRMLFSEKLSLDPAKLKVVVHEGLMDTKNNLLKALRAKFKTLIKNYFLPFKIPVELYKEHEIVSLMFKSLPVPKSFKLLNEYTDKIWKELPDKIDKLELNYASSQHILSLET